MKKCRPTKREGRFVVAAISVMEREEVLEAKIVSGGQAASRAWIPTVSSRWAMNCSPISYWRIFMSMPMSLRNWAPTPPDCRRALRAADMRSWPVT